MPTKDVDFSKDIRIDPNGDVHVLESPDKYYGLAFLQEQVKGYIECVPCPFSDEHIGIANEEGLCIGMEPNPKASWMFQRILVGPILLIHKSKMEE